MRPSSKSLFKGLLITLNALIVAACGDNVFSSLPPTNYPLEATKLLEISKSEKAIELLLKGLGPEIERIYLAMSNVDEGGSYIQSEDAISTELRIEIDLLIAEGKESIPAMVSILASAHAQKVGVDSFDIALELADNKNSNGSPSALAALYPALPESTVENIRKLNEALAILNAISTADTTNADNFKKALFLVAGISLSTKGLDTNPADGKISAEEAANLTAETASLLINSISLAAIAAIGGDEAADDTVGSRSTQVITELQTEISSASGSSELERVQSLITTVEEEEN